MESPDRRTVTALWAFVAIGAVSCSMLMYEILLTRVAALRLYFHFGFLIISNCLLGIGAAGSLITIFQERWRPRSRQMIWRALVAYLFSLGIAYTFLLRFDIPETLTLSNPEHFLRFSAFNMMAAVPFFTAGLAVGMLLTFFSHSVNRLYATDLVGAAVGCLLCPAALAAFGAGGVILVVGLLGLVAALFATPPAYRRIALPVGVLVGSIALWLVPSLDSRFPVPTKEFAAVTEDKSLDLDAGLEFSRWSTGSRIDLYGVPDDERLIFSRGSRGLDIPIPEQRYINQDGTAGTYMVNFSEFPEGLRALEPSLYMAAFAIRNATPSVFVIGVGGGNDLWAALHAGARRIKGIELNRPILDVHREVLPRFSRDLIESQRVELVHAEGRSSLMREQDRWDVIQMSGIDTWTALASGAYVLAENYLYTTEAMQEMYRHLEDEGVLSITRFAADMEALRLLSTANAALEGLGVDDFERSVICLGAPDRLFTMLVKRGVYSDEESARVRDFAQRAGISLLYSPDSLAEPVRRDNLPACFIRAEVKQEFVDAFPRNISPTRDDRPYFFNYTRWRDPVASLELVSEPTYVSQGNPAFILAQIGFSAMMALGLIVLPLALSRHARVERRLAGRFLLYFLGLGAGFIAIEIALIQKLTLFLGHPIYSITVTLFSVLVFTGIGSLVSERWFERSRRLEMLLPIGIASTVVLFVVVFPLIVEAGIGLPLALRAAITSVALAPISFLLGVPFAYGVRMLNKMNPTLIPWAWAVNGGFSVVGSVATVVVSMNLGFTAVLIGAISIYLIAFAALPAAGSRPALLE